MVRRPENRDENHRLRSARVARGLKIAECARVLEKWAHQHGYLNFHCSEDTYRRWEYGHQPRDSNHAVLTGYFGKTLSELGICEKPDEASATPSPMVRVAPSISTMRESPTHRRELITGGLGLLLPIPPMPARVEMRHVRELDNGTARLRAGDQLHGGGTHVAAAEDLLEHGHALIAVRSYSDQVSRRLYSAVGSLAVQAGWLCYDAGDLHRAHAHFKEGLLAATVGRDDPVAVHALATLALPAEDMGRHREALSFVQAAQDMAGQWAHPALRALLLSRQAAQWAALGDLTRSEDLSAEAHDTYEPPPEDTWFSFVDEGELYTTEGYGLAAGGHPERGAALFTRAVADTSPLRPRNAVSRRLLLANAHAAAGDPNGAVEQADKVVGQVAELGSARLRDSVRRLRRMLVPHQRLRSVVQFEERTRTLA